MAQGRIPTFCAESSGIVAELKSLAKENETEMKNEADNNEIVKESFMRSPCDIHACNP